MEKFFKFIQEKTLDKESNLHKQLKRVVSQKEFIFFFNICNEKFPKMSQINRFLKTHGKVWTEVKLDFYISSDCPLPDIGDSLIYGALSDLLVVHNPGLQNITISNMADVDFKTLFSELCRYFKMHYSEYIEELSELP